MRTSPRPSLLRRGVAASTLALAVGLLAIAGPSCGSTVVVAECAGDEVACGTSCVDLLSDPENCGACASACEDGATCQDGLCTGGSCPPPLAECFGSCVDLSSDAQNCGGCGAACIPGQSCYQGFCGGQVCPPGTLDCGGLCADILYDPNNCGGCGFVCAPGEGCFQGYCDGQVCPPGYVDCFGQCVDIWWDPFNCGGCGIVCSPDQSCFDGFCQGGMCPPGTVDCFGQCTDISWDFFNCGGCGIACSPGEQCANGVCEAVGCPPGYVSCNNVCVNPQTNPQHCGACGVACGPNQVCEGGACVGCQGPVLCGLCNYQDVGLPQSVSGNTSGSGDYYSPGCVPPGSGENAFLITASTGGLYVFDTFGSSYDTALSVVDPASCMEFACNDDAMNLQSQVQVPLAAGQQVLVVVDGFAGQMGPYTMNVTAPVIPACGDGDLGSVVPQTFTGSTLNAGNDFQGNCGGQGGNDRAYSFTAPFSGNFTFNTFGTTWDTVLHLRSGCNGMPIACNDDSSGLQSSVTIFLNAGQQILVIVDGFSSGSQGNFTLNISG